MNENCTIIEPLKSREFIKAFASDVEAGLTSPFKHLPCKYIYDERGSKLFSRIAELPEYYIFRCELDILESHKASICSCIEGSELNVVELGAGDGRKTKVLLNHLLHTGRRFTYYPLDICESSVKGLTGELCETVPDIRTHGLVAEFTRGIKWLSHREGLRNLVVFLGSSIGNFSRTEAVGFLTSLREAMNTGDYLLTGFDLQKDVAVMGNAYNDSEGLTADFNLNLLGRINRELGGEFDLGRFRFYSTWDPGAGAVKSYLISTSAQEVKVNALERSFGFDKWEPIHTESSHKFSPKDIEAFAARAGFEVVEHYYDSRQYFSDSLWRAA